MDERYWHAELDLDVHGISAVTRLTDYRDGRRWRVVVDHEGGIIAYADPAQADAIVAALNGAVGK